MNKKEEDLILRNWNIVWTLLAIILSIFVIFTAFKIAYSGFQIDSSKACDDCDINSVTISTDYGLFMHLFGNGLIALLISLVLLFLVWSTRKWLCGDGFFVFE